jgi:hypothetical protein
VRNCDAHQPWLFGDHAAANEGEILKIYRMERITVCVLSNIIDLS